MRKKYDSVIVDTGEPSGRIMRLDFPMRVLLDDATEAVRRACPPGTAVAVELVLGRAVALEPGDADYAKLRLGIAQLKAGKKDDARKTVLTAWQERKKDERLHPFLEEKAPLGLAPYLQAQLLARHVRGDMDAYPPWFWK